MIALLGSMLRARWAQALTVFLLAMVATAAAVAGPVALRAVDAAVVANEVGASSTAERTVSFSSPDNPSDAAAADQFGVTTSLLALPGFTTVRAGELIAFGPVPAGAPDRQRTTSRVAFRDEVCVHLVIVVGRCLAGTTDVVIGADLAQRAGLHPGDRVDLQAEAGANGQAVADGETGTFTVAGIYRPRDPDEQYWAAQYYFPLRADGTYDEAVFVSAGTFDLIDHKRGLSSADILIPMSELDQYQLATLPGRIDALGEAAQTSNTGVTVTSQVAALAARVEHGRKLAHQLVPVAFLPLIGLSWFVVFLAVGYGVGGRRGEFGLITLRGVRAARRWWLGLAEALLMIVVAAPIGYLIGHLVVAAVARFGPGGLAGGSARIGLAEVPYAAVAVGGALVVAVLAEHRALREPVVELLRGVPRPGPAWGSYVVEALVVLLAGLGVLQLRQADGLIGVALLVPGLVIVAVGLLAARGFLPLAGLVARMALRRGRLGAGLAAVALARRPGSQRVFVLIAVATGVLAFVAAGQSVAVQARDEQAGIAVGAASVLTIANGRPAHLLAVTRAVDPQGRWAMAAVDVDRADRSSPPVLAVDSGRWSAVAAGRAALTSATLGPPPGQLFVLRGDTFTADLERSEPTAEDLARAPASGRTPLPVTIGFESLTDGTAVSATVAVLPGRQSYVAAAPGCADGCRLIGISANPGGVPVALTLYGLHAPDPGSEVVPVAVLSDIRRWRGADSTMVGSVTDGLRMRPSIDAFSAGTIVVSAVTAPVPVPVLATAATATTEAPRTITGIDGQDLGIRVVGTVETLPQLGQRGLLVDLDYLTRMSGMTAGPQSGQVWLGPDAPADAIDQLRRAGLSVLDSTSAAQVRSRLDRSGPALALRFHVVAGILGIALAVGGLWLATAVDRGRRADDLIALRQQGLRRRFVRRAALWSYLWLVLGAAAAGLLAAAAAWWATGDRLPVLTDSIAAPAPRWPNPSTVAGSWAVAVAVLVAIAVAGSVALWRTATSREPRRR